MEIEVKQWFVNANLLSSCVMEGEIERVTGKAILFNGHATIRPIGRCCKCGKELTDPVSITIGIGPICLGADIRDIMTDEDKREYIRKFSQEHTVKMWIPKSVITNEVKLPEVEKIEETPDISALVWKGEILIRSKYEYADDCRSIPGGKWNKAGKYWQYPLSEQVALDILRKFSYVVNKKISQEIKDMAARLTSNQEVKTSTTLPDVPLERRKAKEHQKQAFWFSKTLQNAALLMEQGCMKTGVAIRLIDHSDAKKVLVICPEKVVRVWPKEYRKDGMRNFTVVACEVKGKSSSVDDRFAIAKCAYEENENTIIVINYDSVWRDSIYTSYTDKGGVKRKRFSHYEGLAKWLMEQHWDMIILDESHRAKQFDGKTGHFIGDLGLKHPEAKKLIMTGTLMSHDPMDAFNQYLFLDHTVFGSSFYKFRSRYAKMGGYGGLQIVGFQNQDEMHEKIYSIAFRVTKEVLDLPEEMHIPREFDLNPKAQKYYDEMRDYLAVYLDEDRVDATIVLTQMLRMQQITSGYLPIMKEIEQDNGKVKRELERVERIDSGKAELLQELIEDIDEHEPVVVFCRFQHDLDEIKAVAKKLGRTYGEISGRGKDALSDEAELQDGIQIAGVQIQAGGVGIDLTKARYAIYYSIGYSLGDYEQSLARIHRPGQTRPVVYYHLIAANTIDTVIYNMLKRKKDVVNAVLETKVLEEELNGEEDGKAA